MNQNQYVFSNRDLADYSLNSEVTIRGRIDKIYCQFGIIYVIIRQELHTIQCIYYQQNETDQLAKMIIDIPKESIVDIFGIIKNANVESCSVYNIELEIKSINIISKADFNLPIEINEHVNLSNRQNKLLTKLNYRVLDLRKSHNRFIFKFRSIVCQFIRKFLDQNGFIEIHTPKLINITNQTNIFDNYLVQYPCLYQQLAICADFSRIYEIGSTYIKKSSNKLTEFTGINIEMTIEHDYHEILNFFDKIFIDLFEYLKNIFKEELDIFNMDFNIKPFKLIHPTINITFSDVIELLGKSNLKLKDGDFNTKIEKIIGKIIREKYHTDFFIISQLPTNLSQFYTMPNKENTNYSNSYCFYLRGKRILSGSQRIHNYHQLIESIKLYQIDSNKIKDYLESFKYGVPLHGGGTLCLEQLITSYLGIKDIRNVSLFS